MALPRHSYETFIRATPAEVWAAITQPQFTRRYFHDTSFESDLEPGSRHRYVLAGDVTAVDGTIEEVDEGRRLVMTWHVLYDAAMAEEPPSRVEWILRPANDDATVTRLTVNHYDLGLSPLTSDNVALGWVGVLHSLKSMLETGEGLGPLTMSEVEAAPSHHRSLAAEANNSAWDLLGRHNLSEDHIDELIELAHAASHHWRQATQPGAIQRARAAWMLARCHTVAGHADLALRHAQRCAALTAESPDSADFDHVYALEALARANALCGEATVATEQLDEAWAIPVADPEDRRIIEGDLVAEPWFGIERSATVSQ